MTKKVHFFSWDERRDIAHPGNREATLIFAVEHFLSCAKEAIERHGYFSVALSGGSTPKTLFSALSRPPHSTEIDWSKVLLFWSDERHVPPTDPKSNFRMAMQAGLKTLSIPAEHIFRMEAKDPIKEHAMHYENKLQEILGHRPLDFVMLGMGEDGHTASLFPHTEALLETKRWVVANYVPKKKVWRMTLSYPYINRARNIVLYVLGKTKQKMVASVFLEPHEPPYPVSLIGTEESKALWVLDTDAGKLLLEKRKK